MGMKRTTLRSLIALAATLVVAALVGTSAGASTTTTANGTWEAYPGQSTSNQTAVQQPINADGTSNFKANGKTVIPVKFALSQGTGPLLFESIGSDTNTADDASFLSFTPNTSTTFNQIQELSANYTFTLGDCHGGSLRWQVRTSPTQAVFIYYGTPPSFGNGGVGGCTPSSPGGTPGSTMNLINQPDLRYDTSQYAGGTFYDTYAHTQTLIGTTPIVRASLVLDSGWQQDALLPGNGDQRLTLSSATFKTAAYTDTFAPAPSSTPAPTCNLPTDATIKITKVDGSPSGDVNEPLSIQPNDTNLTFRVVDCKLMYNLATSSLSGVGTYKVYAVINGVAADNPATFDLK
jgi:hypothetical protein